MLARGALLALGVAAALSGCKHPPTSNDDTGHGSAGSPALFAGGRRTCLRRGGALRCWGAARYGSLGPAVTMSSTPVPTALPGLGGAVEVAFGENHGCARMAGGTVRCWGSNAVGQLGNNKATGTSPAPVTVSGLSGVTAIAAGGDHTCVIIAGGVKCWGDEFGAKPRAIAVAGATAIAVAGSHACALVRGGAVECWGANNEHQLGAGRGHAQEPRPVPGLTGVDEIAASGDYSCARRGGQVSCWGENDSAQLGDPSRKDRAKPVRVSGLDDAVALALGESHACALRETGQVVCWGGASIGPFGSPQGCPKASRAEEVGPGRIAEIKVFCAAPMPVPGLSKVTQLVHGMEHACALTRSGAVECWGAGEEGELGNRAHGPNASATPVAVAFVKRRTVKAATALQIATGQGWSCAVLPDATVRCWGNGTLGELGPTVRNLHAAPVAIPGLSGVKAVSLGVYHGCALLKDGGVRCWGFNGNGELGDGTTRRHTSPVTPLGLPTPVIALAAAPRSDPGYTCALVKGGRIWCWGANENDQAVPGGPARLKPTPVPGISGATAIAAGHAATCAVVSGHVRCWGNMVGRQISRSVDKPTAVPGLDDAVEIAMGYDTYCARERDGSVWCWGHRVSDRPVRQALGAPARAIAIGASAVAELADGSVRKWWPGQSGGGETIAIDKPVQISCADIHCCALDAASRAYCWGNNADGQLGNPEQGIGGDSDAPNPVGL